MNSLPFLICCAAAVFTGSAIKRLVPRQSASTAMPSGLSSAPGNIDHPLNTPVSSVRSASGHPGDAWSIPDTLHPSLRPHRADLDALIAAASKDKAAADTAVTALYYLFQEDLEAALTYARHPAIREIPGATASVVRSLQYTDPARAVTMARELNHPELLPAAILLLAEQYPAAAAHELETGGLVFPDSPDAGRMNGHWDLLPDIIIPNGSGGMRHATPQEVLAFRIQAIQAVDKLAAERAEQ